MAKLIGIILFLFLIFSKTQAFLNDYSFPTAHNQGNKNETHNNNWRKTAMKHRMDYDILSTGGEETGASSSEEIISESGCHSLHPSLRKSSCHSKRRRGRRSKRSSPEYPTYEELKILSRNISGILDAFSKNYDRKVRPNYGDAPVEVGVTMFVLMISSISEVLMDFTVDFYFRQYWKDPRLKYTGPVNTLSVGSDFLKQIWVPDTFFVNEKTSYFHTATTSNEFLRISSEGDITRSLRLTVTAGCNMNLRYFPMDSQLCNIEIESYGYSMADIRYIWAKGPGSVGVEEGLSLPQFKVMGYRQKAQDIFLSTGNYSRLACEIQFVRSMGYYLIQIYIPSILIVVISWVSFWVNRNAAPARVYLGITTVLTMTTLMSSTNKELPKISYVKSIDVFLGTCFVMVFAALLEYATVGYLAKHIQMRKNHFASLQKMATEVKAKQEAERKEREDALAKEEALQALHEQRQRAASAAAQAQQYMYEYTYKGRVMAGGVGGPMTLNNNPAVPSSSSGYNLHHREGFRPPPSFPDSFTMEGLHRTPSRRGGEYAQYPQTGLRADDKVGRVEVKQEATTIRPKVPINPNQVCGITPSDIDKYSRVVFPVCFICFNMLYWIIYLHISHVDPGDLTLLA